MKQKWLAGLAAMTMLATGSSAVHAAPTETIQKLSTLPSQHERPQTKLTLNNLITKAVWNKHKHTKLLSAGSFQMPSKKAEIISSTPDGQTLVVTEAELGSISIVSIESMENIHVKGQISFRTLSSEAEVTSVVITPDGKYALTAIRTGDTLQNANKGLIAVVDLDKQAVVHTYEVGIGPDSIALSKDGTMLVVCNEDEEAEDGEVNMKLTQRPGSISILEFPNGDVRQGIHTEIPISLETTGNQTIYKHDPQPEYVSISPNGKKAAVTLQENNAIAILDLRTKSVSTTFGLGITTHAADLKKDEQISFTDTLTARPEADGVTWDPSGNFLITANEGDLGKDELKDGIRSGGRNISVWRQDGSLVYDSMNLIDEQSALAGLYPDSRSNNRGSEVENVATGKIEGNSLLAVAAERSNAVLFFDISYPTQPVYLGLVPSAGEGPEGIHKINGRNLFVSADEVDGILSFYAVTKK